MSSKEQAIRERFPIGSKCMRHMGIGVWWVGKVQRITDDAKVVVLFSADANGGIACPFEADEHLIPAPTMPSEAAELLEKIEMELQENAELIEAASRPQWPAGYFDRAHCGGPRCIPIDDGNCYCPCRSCDAAKGARQ